MAERYTAEEGGRLGVDESHGRCTGIPASRLYQRIRKDQGRIGDALDENAKGVDHP